MPMTSLTAFESPLGRWEVARRRSLSSLRGYSAGYIALKGDIQPKQEVNLPTGDPSIVVNFGSPFWISEAGSAQRREVRTTVSVMGPHDRPFVAENPHSRELVVLHLTPIGAHAILDANMRELTNRWLSLEDVLGPDAGQLAEQLQESRTWPERFDQLDSFLCRRVAAKRRPQRDMRQAWNRLRGARTSVQSLARELGISNKHLIHQFHNQVGLTPKTVARVARFNKALRMTDGAKHVDWAATAQRCGYFDQAHLIRDFRELALATPRAIAALRDEFVLSAI
jgi:AraC-like DNA-binding protein